jgi:hypothetical protein
MSLIQPNDVSVLSFDRASAFELYSLFVGDPVRTAAALNVNPVDVVRVADEDGWNVKLASILTLKKSAKPGDTERAISSAISFVQAHRMRMFLDRTLTRLMGMSADELDALLMQETLITGKDGSVRVTKKLSTRPLADLASALEKCNSILQQCLHDTASDRAKRQDAQDPIAAAGEVHQMLAAAMSKVRESTTPRAILFDAQIEIAQTIVKAAPEVDDRHVEED